MFANSSFHTFLGMTFRVVRQRRNTKIFRAWWFFSSLRGKSRSKHGSVIVHNFFAYFTFSLSTSQVYMIMEKCWFPKINFFIEYFPHRINVLFLSSQFDVTTQIRITLFRSVRISILSLETFSQPYFKKGISQIAFPITVLPKDDRTDFAQEERLGLPYWTMILATCVVVDESKCLGVPSLEFSIILDHLPFLTGYCSRYCVSCLSCATGQSGYDIHDFCCCHFVTLMNLVQ